MALIEEMAWPWFRMRPNVGDGLVDKTRLQMAPFIRLGDGAVDRILGLEDGSCTDLHVLHPPLGHLSLFQCYQQLLKPSRRR